MSIDFKIVFVGKFENEEWGHFKWLATVNDECFTFKTGLGWSKPKYGKPRNERQSLWESKQPNKKPNDGKTYVTTDTEWAEVPTKETVLEALFSDADCGNQSFDEFCDNLGYSNDSLKALDTYRACMDTSKRLRKALDKDYNNEYERINKNK